MITYAVYGIGRTGRVVNVFANGKTYKTKIAAFRKLREIESWYVRPQDLDLHVAEIEEYSRCPSCECKIGEPLSILKRKIQRIEE